MTTNPHTPAGLGTAGATLWQAILSDVADGYELDRRELTLLEPARPHLDDADLEQALGTLPSLLDD